MAARQDARDAAAAEGGPRKDPTARGKTDAMKVSRGAITQREDKRKEMVERQKRDASG